MASTNPVPESPAQTDKTKHKPITNGHEIFTRSLQIGGGAGALGLFWGTASGIALGSTTPVFFALANGLQWFAQGSVFYGSRRMILERHGPVDKATAFQKVEASTLGAAISGATVIGLIRGSKSIFPAFVVGSLAGGTGQAVVNMWTSSRERASESDGWLVGKWSPMTKLTNREYENILEEKLLRLDAEIAIIDDNIAALRAQKEERVKADAKAPGQALSSRGQA